MKNFDLARVRGGYESTANPPPKRIINKAPPPIREVKRAAAVIKAFCISRSESHEIDYCAECPIKEICLNEPHLWDV